MTTKEVADKLVELCRKGDFKSAQQELYAEDALSVEPRATPAFEKETKGLKAIIEKGEKFDSMVEKMHGIEVSDPIVADNSFACTMMLDVTMKERGPMKMTELCVYEVKDGKIVKEEFVM
ncbi:MAG: nuclear transport factor 2 family protein [Bacteroidota bacterium]|nr:nuclear transport factor 2 family protein [Bacteroidota bacterium]MDQ6888837.1 nuclear transport factor 2 family protein [Bacteroidota bacterium]